MIQRSPSHVIRHFWTWNGAIRDREKNETTSRSTRKYRQLQKTIKNVLTDLRSRQIF